MTTLSPRALLALIVLLSAGEGVLFPPLPAQDDALRVMAWNIWHGGREDGKEVGPLRVAEIIKSSGADLVAMQETYGSGEIISKALGFHFHPRGTNLSIHSRYPVLEDLSVDEPFNSVGALIALPNKKRIAFFSIWLPYGEDIWLPGVRQKADQKALAAQDEPARKRLQSILQGIEKKLAGDAYRDVSVIVAGDFNSMSHLDYTALGRSQYGHVIEWTPSQLMTSRGFRDAFRECHPIPDRQRDATWSPRFVEQEQDRIDFVYYRSQHFRARSARVLRSHAEWFPSDHAAVVTTLRPVAIQDKKPVPLRVASYNIHHGGGNDDKVQIMRTGKVLRDLEADVIALQEVDLGVKRSARVEQARVLGQALGYHAAFGKFMNYQGGDYGLAVLSRYPIVKRHIVPLPKGGEPRVALGAEILLPDDQKILVVCVHFDWPPVDKVRFSQAKALTEALAKIKIPHIILGDFNDRPGSRTLKLFSKGLQARKPKDQRATFPAQKPVQDIDHIFAYPKSRWLFRTVRVVPEKLASDHRPVVADLLLKARR